MIKIHFFFENICEKIFRIWPYAREQNIYIFFIFGRRMFFEFLEKNQVFLIRVSIIQYKSIT
jgi:hypothetical protein